MDPHFRNELTALLPRLRRFARALAGNPDQADDLVQAACERALERASQWQPGTRLDSWLYRIVQSLWIDSRRAASTRGEHLEAIDPDQLCDDRSVRGIEAELTLSSVRRAIAALPENHRLVLVLVCVEGQSYRDAAEVMGVPVGTVMSRLARARMSLSRILRLGEVDAPPAVRNKEVGHGVV